MFIFNNVSVEGGLDNPPIIGQSEWLILTSHRVTSR
jgi:hypothetical protein